MGILYNLGKTPKEKPLCYCSSRLRRKKHALYSDFNDSQICDYYFSKTWKQILKNAEMCRRRSDLGRHFFADLNFDGF